MLPHSRCNFVAERLLVGAIPIETTIDAIAEFGVTMIIDVQDKSDQYVTSIKRYHFPIKKGGAPTKLAKYTS